MGWGGNTNGIPLNEPEETQPTALPLPFPFLSNLRWFSEDFLGFLKSFCQVLIKILLSAFLFIQFPRTKEQI